MKKPKPILRQRREELSLSRRALARLAGVSYNTIVSLETSEKRNPTLDVCKKLSKALGISVEELFGDIVNVM